jgi:hypothetical protein
MKTIDKGLLVGVFLGLVGIYYPIFLSACEGEFNGVDLEAFLLTVIFSGIFSFVIIRLVDRKYTI